VRKRERTSDRSISVGADYLRETFNRSLLHQPPWFTQIFEGGGAFDKNFKLFGWSVATVNQWSSKNDILCYSIGGVYCHDQLRCPDGNKGTLTNYIIFSDKPSLPYLYPSISQYSQQREKRNSVFWLLPITLFGLGAVAFYHGMPQRSFYGFIIVAAASIIWIMATIVTISFSAADFLFSAEHASVPRWYYRVSMRGCPDQRIITRQWSTANTPSTGATQDAPAPQKQP
jgi:hypothetical protein